MPVNTNYFNLRATQAMLISYNITCVYKISVDCVLFLKYNIKYTVIRRPEMKEYSRATLEEAVDYLYNFYAYEDFGHFTKDYRLSKQQLLDYIQRKNVPVLLKPNIGEISVKSRSNDSSSV